MPVFFLFLAVPLVEIALFVVLGGAIGLWPTLAFVLASAVIGVAILKRAGRIGGKTRQDPVRQMAGNGLSLLAGLLLIVPGFLTSALGGLLLIPPVQTLVVAVLGQKLRSATFVFQQTRRAEEDVIDGEFQEVHDPEGPRLPPSKWTRG